jgi:putative tryptophan/tyrosine transport system substrate-binding protein
MPGMRRRKFVTLLSGAVAWPLAARAQEPAMPVIGLLSPTWPDTLGDRLLAFRRGLAETGYVEGHNVAIEYRWAEGQFDRMPELAADLVRRQVSVIAVAGSAAGALAAKAATQTIPIAFGVPEDPVRMGLVASLARPGGNLTGINFLSGELAAKRLEILREFLPAATRAAILFNPANAFAAEAQLSDVQSAARAMGLQIKILPASTSREIDAVFAPFVSERPDALFVAGDAFFTSRRVQLATLAARHMLPMASGTREIVDAGGLMSYGASILDVWRQVGIYVGRVLKGTKPADLPVAQSSKFELIVNAQTARTLGLTVPPSLLARADEVIE